MQSAFRGVKGEAVPHGVQGFLRSQTRCPCWPADQASSAPGADWDDAASSASKAQTACTGMSQLRASKSSIPRRPPGAPGSTSSSTARGLKTGAGSAVTVSTKATSRRPGGAAAARSAASRQHAGVAAADAVGADQQPSFKTRHMVQLVCARVLLSQVGNVCRALLNSHAVADLPAAAPA